ncbi:MAG TPA: alpha-N-arabinofuranosidase [Sedimentisphaerales bacterium]|nr:alpha-N-arabinofuranosidase [Sedimentisphaerales bacterium]
MRRWLLDIVCAETVVAALVIVLGAGCSPSSTPQRPVKEEPVMNSLVIYADAGKETINRNIYGHFAEHLGRCIYGGFWVGTDSPIPNTRGIRNDVVEALRAVKIPVLRWPGGCFADEYHWMDGIGPPEQRPTMVNTHWGGVTENNHFGTHEFLDLCKQLGCEPYICGNLGSGTVLEMQQWVEYITFDGKSPMADLRRENGRDEPWKVKYWGVGNENWGCGGRMRPEFYADQYRRYATYLRNLGDNRLFKVACGPSGANYEWTEVLMRDAGRNMDGLAPHYYCGSGRKSRSATRFEEQDWFAQLQRALLMDELIGKHAAIMDKYDPKKRVAMIVDEWGAWHEVEPGTNPRFLYQQNSLRDALVAGVTLNIFNNHCDRVKMTNIAQTVNVLQAMILTDEEKMILTPTYHVFEMYKVHHDATLLPVQLQCGDYRFGSEKIPGISVSASKDKSGKIHVSLCNLDPAKSREFTCTFQGLQAKHVLGRVLTAEAMTAHNTFDNPQEVKPAAFNAFSLRGDVLTVTLPSKSVVVLEVE